LVSQPAGVCSICPQRDPGGGGVFVVAGVIGQLAANALVIAPTDQQVITKQLS
jgi:hypothetical protein